MSIREKESSTFRIAESINIDREMREIFFFTPHCFYFPFSFFLLRIQPNTKKGNKKGSEIIKNDDMKAYSSRKPQIGNEIERKKLTNY